MPTYLVSQATSYEELLVCAALFGLAGNSFTVGIAWNSAWFPDRSKGTALGVFGAGNVGASGTKFLVVRCSLATHPGRGLPRRRRSPAAGGSSRSLYAVLLVLTAAAVWFLAPRPDRRPGRGRPLAEMLAPLKHVRVWRFSLYYVVVFGAYVALSAWLPNYYVERVRPAARGPRRYSPPCSSSRRACSARSAAGSPTASARAVVTYAVFIGHDRRRWSLLSPADARARPRRVGVHAP